MTTREKGNEHMARTYVVWVKEKDPEVQDSMVIDDPTPWNECVTLLTQMYLTNDGRVPDWVESVRFYDTHLGDQPVATYHGGDTIEKKGKENT